MMKTPFTFLAFAFAFATPNALSAQNTLKDGTALIWDKQINVGMDSLRNDSVTVPALSVPVYEAGAAQVADLLKKALPGSSFKKQGDLLKAQGVSVPTLPAPTDLLARVVPNKKGGMSTITLAFLQPGTSKALENSDLQPAVQQLGVTLNKAVVQGQLDEWKKKLNKADSKTEGATKDRDKAQGNLTKAQSAVEKATKEKNKLQSEQAIQQRQIDLENQKWTLSQDPKDLKRLTKARAKITSIEGKLAKAMSAEAKAQGDLSKSTANMPDAQKEKEAKDAAQAEVQRTVDALQRKLDNIR